MQRDRLGRLCRYITHQPLALDRLTTQPSDCVVYDLTRNLMVPTPNRRVQDHFHYCHFNSACNKFLSGASINNYHPVDFAVAPPPLPPAAA